MERTGIEEDGQTVSRERPGREYVYVMVFELAHVHFLGERIFPFRVAVLFR